MPKERNFSRSTGSTLEYPIVCLFENLAKLLERSFIVISRLKYCKELLLNTAPGLIRHDYVVNCNNNIMHADFFVGLLVLHMN